VTGTLVAGHDVGRWADALGRLLRLPEPQADAMGRAAAAHAATFSWDHTTDALLASYRRAIREYTIERRGVGA
jgi:D-inositol-3-phosphate glycosyltransferase